MFRISKKLKYALRALVFLAQNHKKGELFSIKEISEREEIPFDFLEKIVSQLEKRGLVRGKKGKGGGYILSRSPNSIKVQDIIWALGDEKKLRDCFVCKRNKKCLSKKVWLRLERTVNQVLQSTTLKKITK